MSECGCYHGLDCTKISVCSYETAIEELEADLTRMKQINKENGYHAAELQAQLAASELARSILDEGHAELLTLCENQKEQLEAVREQILLMPQSGNGYDYWVCEFSKAAIGEDDILAPQDVVRAES